jgi:MFS family permease
LSTFVRTNPAKAGYGLGLTSASASYIIGAYVVSLLVGAALFARVSASTTPRVVLLGATLFVAAGYLSLIALHGSVPEVLACMMVAGFGSGALVAALPAAAAAAAPPHQTGVATGLTNTTKSIGGSFASSTFALALMAGAADGVDSTAASMSGYLTAWAICGGTALLATVALRAVPKVAFTGASAEMIAGAELT